MEFAQSQTLFHFSFEYAGGSIPYTLFVSSILILIKYAISSFNYHNIINTLAEFENIGPSHMRVKQLGYDGNCFPKDMEAFANFLDSEFLKGVIKVNESLVSSR